MHRYLLFLLLLLAGASAPLQAQARTSAEVSVTVVNPSVTTLAAACVTCVPEVRTQPGMTALVSLVESAARQPAERPALPGAGREAPGGMPASRAAERMLTMTVVMP